MNNTKQQWTLLSICLERIADKIELYASLPIPSELKEKLLNKLLTKEEILDKDINLALFLDADIKKIDLTFYIQRQSLASFTELFTSLNATLTHLAINNFSNLSLGHAKVIATCNALEFLDLRSTNVDDDMLAVIISSCNQIKYLDISKCSQLRRITHSLNNIETLKTGVIRPTSYALVFANTNGTTLKSLQLDKAEDKSILNKVLDNCYQLSSLRIDKVQIEWPQSFRNLTALEDLSVQFMDDRVFDSLLEYCPKLKSLEIAKSVRLTAENFDKFGERCQNIERLYINNSLFVDQMFFQLAERATRLKSLALCSCMMVSEEGLAEIVRKRTTLEELSLIDTTVSDSILLQLAENNKTSLKSITLKSTTHMTSDVIQHVCTTITSLTKLSLRTTMNFESFSSKYLKSLLIKTEQGLKYTKSIDCPSLTRLDLVPRLSDGKVDINTQWKLTDQSLELVESLLSQSVNLVSLSIAVSSQKAFSLLCKYQTSLEVLNIDHKQVKKLPTDPTCVEDPDLVSCVEFEQLLALNRLRSVTASMQIQSIDIQSVSLRSLDLTCSGRLSIEAPNLRSLVINATLAELALRTPRLVYLNVYSQTPFKIPSTNNAPSVEKIVLALWNDAPLEGIMCHILDQFSRLRELSIIGGKAENLSLRSTSLAALRLVRNTELVFIDAKDCPNLNRLELSRCYEMTADRILESLNNCPSVKRVTLDGGQGDTESTADLLILQTKRMDIVFD